ncbi:MAG: Mov34/MPN/PAD-1 family protein [Deltaproteobacteria bacterium]|nr:Mov34/MPN/PAD-1 family protein [Deltaproteobacteria bacterium]
MDEPVFFAEDSSEVAEHFDVPEGFTWAGSVPESDVDPAMPTIYLEWAVAKRLQFEAQRSIEVDLEVAGILLGTRSADSQIIKVSHIAVARDEDSSPVHFKFSYSVWDDLIDQMEELSQKAGEELLLLGWYHTHPNMAVFLSRYDLRTHRDFARPYQFALVLAPKAGTDQTAVGFFCNRGGGTPLLPGLRLYGVPKGQDVGRVLPWGFQSVEADGVYEGEGDDTEDAASLTVSSKPEITQLGVVRMEDPDWLTLGEDPSEGPVLAILEGMAASVVETKQDRIAVLLGTKTKDNHITINRVRFLGTMGDGPDQERADILGALRFMAEAFPAHSEQKILGVVRIVSPHRFRRGDAYDPIEHNIRIALLLGEVGYDLDQVPFQVGIALYPGIEDDTLFFQVFAQHKTSRPVPLMSMRALAAPAMSANERYEPVDGPIFNIDDEPCLKPPAWGALKVAQDEKAKREKEAARPPSAAAPASQRGNYVDPTTTGTDWDAVEDDDEDKQASGGVPLLLLGVGVVALVLIGALLVFLGGSEVEESPEAGAGATEPVQIEGEPYEFSITGCGAGWNPTQTCSPLGPDGGVAALVRVKRLPAYDAATFQPLEAWLLPKVSQDRPKVRLERSKEGSDWVFSVSTESERWTDFWGDGSDFRATLTLLPRGAELAGGDEWAPLRRTSEILLSGTGGEPEDEGSEGGDLPQDPPPVGAPTFHWKASGDDRHAAVYDRARLAFTAPLFIDGDGTGAWTVSVKAGSRALGRGSSSSVLFKSSQTNLAPAIGEVMKTPALNAKVTGLEGDAPKVTISLRPPDKSAPLTLDVTLRGEGTVDSIEHRLCVMAKREDGEPLLGAKAGETTNDVVGEFSVNPKGGRKTFAERDAFAQGSCGSGNSSRWANVQFGGEPMQLNFSYTGSDENIAVRVPAKYTIPETTGLYEPGSNACFTITVTLDAAGNQSRAPKVQKQGAFVSGSCN